MDFLDEPDGVLAGDPATTAAIRAQQAALLWLDLVEPELEAEHCAHLRSRILAGEPDVVASVATEAASRLQRDGHMALDARDFQRARTLLRASLDLADDATTWRYLGHVRAAIGDRVAAVAAFTRAKRMSDAEGPKV